MMVEHMPLWMLQLATEAAELGEEMELEDLEEAGGLVSQILGSNLVNILIIVGLLVYLGRNVIGDILANRKAVIMKELNDAKTREQAAAKELAEQKQKLAQAQQEAERIKQQATATAESVRADLLAQAEQDVAKIRATAEKDVASAQEQVIEELRRRIALQALAKVEAELPNRMSDSVHRRFMDQNIQLLGGQG